MTTIAYRDGILCADTAVFDRGVYCGMVEKIVRAPDGAIGGWSGRLNDVSQFLGWMKRGACDDQPKIENEESECILIRPDGSVWWSGYGGLSTQMAGEFFALGSGWMIALGAMAAGASAERAVEICADFDNMTRRPLQVERLIVDR